MSPFFTSGNFGCVSLSVISSTESPYIVKVVDPGKIRISGGWRPLLDDNERIPLVVGKEKQIPFDASAAGPGELTADVRGPTTKIPTAVETRPGGRHTLVFTPEEEGIN